MRDGCIVDDCVSSSQAARIQGKYLQRAKDTMERLDRVKNDEREQALSMNLLYMQVDCTVRPILAQRQPAFLKAFISENKSNRKRCRWF